ncbi:MAG TPA: hypothetical protein VIX86_20605 [Streptosporangiaceae bacterium]
MQNVLPLITGSSGALVVLAVVAYLFLAGRLHSDAEYRKLVRENDDLKAALADERRAVDEAMRTGTVTNQLITALTQLAENRRPIPPPAPPHRPAPALELTGEDLGL